MRVLAIDPGISTGVVLLDDDGTVLQAHTLTEHALSSLTTVALLADVVVMERLPEKVEPILARIVTVLKTWFPDAVLIGPGTWKPVMATRMIPDLPSVHQRDAYGLGAYYQFTKGLINVRQDTATVQS